MVTLTGHVETFAEKSAAETAARRVKGVEAIVEEIKIKLACDVNRSDEDIEAAANRIAGDVCVPSDAVKVTVEQGWITLDGEVDWNFQKETAEQCLHRLLGVVGVTNMITIKPKVDVSNIQDDITHALNRSWFFDPQTISVTARGGRVRLVGTVKSPHERQVAAATAWSASGVTDFENERAIA